MIDEHRLGVSVWRSVGRASPGGCRSPPGSSQRAAPAPARRWGLQEPPPRQLESRELETPRSRQSKGALLLPLARAGAQRSP